MTRADVLPMKWTQVVIPYDEDGKVQKWCEDVPGAQFGHTTTIKPDEDPDWALICSVFFFEQEEDAMLFTLKWGC